MVRVRLMALFGAIAVVAAVVVPASASAATSYVVANAGANSITTYAGLPSATSNQAPTSTLAGAATGLSQPSEIATGTTGILYVANRANNSVTEYAAGATGNTAPTATITGVATGLSSPAGIAVDRNGRVYVANAASNTITEYAAGMTGNVAPSATLSGAATRLATPVWLELDSAANLFVVNQTGNSVTEYRSGATANTAPTSTLTGAATGLGAPDAIALSSFDDLLVANTNPAGLTVYQAGSAGNTAPLNTIATTGVTTPAGLALVDSATILVAGRGSNNVVAFGGATPAGNAGAATGLSGPTGVLVDEPLNLTGQPALFPQLTVGHAYKEHSYAYGGTPPYRWSIASGTLPAGLTLNTATGGISGTPTTPGTATVVLRVTDSAAPPGSLTNTRTYTVFPAVQPSVFIANGGNSLVNSFPLSMSGNIAPLSTFGTSVGINAPSGLAFDSFGNLFVANYGAGTITEYRGGRVAQPVGTDSGLTSPAGVTVGPHVAVSQQAANAVSEYSYDPVTGFLAGPGHLGDISGPSTGLSAPAGVLYTGGLLWVANEGNDSVTAYTPGVYGNVAPVKTISGLSTGLAHPDGLAVDATGDLYVANQFGPSVTVFAPGANGDIAPIRTITGSATTLRGPTGLDLDAAGNLYVANGFTTTVVVFPPNANGNIAPTGTYGGSNTGITGPTAVAVTPPLTIITKRLPRAHKLRRYHVQLRAVEGTTPYRWSILRGHLPPGLHLSRSGVITGRPKQAGSYHFTVVLRDSSHPRLRLTRRFTLVVRQR